MNRSIGYFSAAYFKAALVAMLALIGGLYVLNIIIPSIVVFWFITGVGIGLILVPVVVPAWRVAGRFKEVEGRPMSPREGWLFAPIFAVLSGVGLALITAVFAAFGAPLAVNVVNMFAQDSFFALTSIGFYGVCLALFNRIILWLR